ncbi:MAG: GDSL-type esterase/lipase family protein [Kineosporiaceae bacterium]
MISWPGELSRGAVLAFAPVVLVQGLRVRRTTPRLPEAAHRTGRLGEVGEDALTVVLVGDSVAAGVGIEDHEHTVAGRLATILHARTGRSVAWSVLARSGADAAAVADLLGDGAGVRGADLVVVSVGVNDVKDLRSDDDWRVGLRRLLQVVTAAAPGALVAMVGLPPVERFPALPWPLSALLGARARRLDRIGREVAATVAAVVRLEVGVEEIGDVGAAFADDGFHPGPALHAALAQRAADVFAPDQADTALRRGG